MNGITRIILALSLISAAYAADDVVSAVHGTVDKVDASGHTIVVKTADGTEHSVHFLDSTTVHGAHAAAAGATDSWHGIEKGSDVVVHYTKRGTDDTAVEIDKVGKGGLKATEGTITGIDRGAKTIAVKTADGTEETFHLTDHAAKDAGKGIAEGSEKGSKVVVYSTEKAGKKVAHFFEGA
jgi:hypothetical protein